MAYKTFQYSSIKEKPLFIRLDQAEKKRLNTVILYLHGGGLVYGTASDLPDAYRDLFLQAGYDVAAIDYPLAPEVNMTVIMEKLTEGLAWIENHYDTYILFGRSAGAYLAVLLAQKTKWKPRALLLFYGFYSLKEASFQVPNRYYLTFPKVSKKLYNQLVTTEPLVDGPKETRFALYIYLRQSGNWIKELVGDRNSIDVYSLTHQDLQELPPAFIAASTEDPDVPFRISRKMAQLIPNAHLETIESNEHDFDRDGTAIAVYEKALSWLHHI